MYNPDNDKVLKEWEIPVSDTSRAVVSLKRYDGGDPKLVLGVQRITKGDGARSLWPVSRLLRVSRASPQAQG